MIPDAITIAALAVQKALSVANVRPSFVEEAEVSWFYVPAPRRRFVIQGTRLTLMEFGQVIIDAEPALA